MYAGILVIHDTRGVRSNRYVSKLPSSDAREVKKHAAVGSTGLVSRLSSIFFANDCPSFAGQ
jgi:hypothetical protein